MICDSVKMAICPYCQSHEPAYLYKAGCFVRKGDPGVKYTLHCRSCKKDFSIRMPRMYEEHDMLVAQSHNQYKRYVQLPDRPQQGKFLGEQDD